MFIHTCPLTGHTRKFTNGRAAKRWLAEQAAKYVPTLAEDIKASREATLGVGRTTAEDRKLSRSRKGGKALGGIKGRFGRFSEQPDERQTYGMVSHYTRGKPVIGVKVRFKE